MQYLKLALIFIWVILFSCSKHRDDAFETTDMIEFRNNTNHELKFIPYHFPYPNSRSHDSLTVGKLEVRAGFKTFEGESNMPGFSAPWQFYRSDFLPSAKLIIDDTLVVNFCSPKFDTLLGSIGNKNNWVLNQSSSGKNFANYNLTFDFEEIYYQELLEVVESNPSIECE